MPALRDFIDGPWRAVPVLGVTQILSWGTIFYTPVLILPLIAAERGWSMSFAMGGFSVGLLAAGLVAPYVGRLIDRFGGHVVMTIGSLVGALGRDQRDDQHRRVKNRAPGQNLGDTENRYGAPGAVDEVAGSGHGRPVADVRRSNV